MRREEIIISGFGGQGVLSMGKILAYAGIMQGMEVSWMPAYGPEQRGGTANVTVIIGDEEIASPLVDRFDSAVVLNQPSLDKFEPLVKPGGCIIYDAYAIHTPPARDDVSVYKIDAMEEASRKGNGRLLNMFVLGGLIKARGVVSVDNVVRGLGKVLPQRYHPLIPDNEAAIRRGMEMLTLVER